MRLSPVLLPCLLVTACAPAEPAPATVTLYCYRTLADTACYLRPDRGREGRLLGVVAVAATPELRLRQAALGPAE